MAPVADPKDSSMYVYSTSDHQHHRKPKTKPWFPEKSSALYNVHGWGAPYFVVNAKGHMAVRPHGSDTKLNEDIDLTLVLQRALKPKAVGGLGLSPPLLIRFPDVLRHRLEKLQTAFDESIKACAYQARFQGVFPVKCNQDRFVVNNIVDFGKAHAFGLEAGSKPELLLAMSSLCKVNANSLLICNGYKDMDYVGMALRARQLGINCVIVLEQERELDLVLDMSSQLCVEPIMGLRARLTTKHGGHFGETSGEKGKFGLSSREMIQVVQKLSSARKLDCLQLLHFHIGSQIPSLAILNDGVSEATHIYCEFARMGANMKYIDIGGGLGLDYDGSNSADSDMSVGYTMEEYANEVVQTVKKACMVRGVNEPILCSESGRALVSHHSVLVFDVLSARHKDVRKTGREFVSTEPVQGLPESLRSLYESVMHGRDLDFQGTLERAEKLKLNCLELFKQGQLNLMQWASISNLYDVVWTWVEQSRNGAPSFTRAGHGDASQMGNHASVYHINLSVFKSMPDTWAIGQLFPIVPLQRLDEEPKVSAVLSDLTCDSDGQVALFVGLDRGHRMKYLRVHELQEGKPYYMAMFLGGAYQEALGGLHNLFGAPAAVQVWKKGNGPNCWKVTKVSDGQTSADVLKMMHHQPEAMLDTFRLRVQKSLNEGGILDEESASMAVKLLSWNLGSSTYLYSNHLSSSAIANAKMSFQ